MKTYLYSLLLAFSLFFFSCKDESSIELFQQSSEFAMNFPIKDGTISYRINHGGEIAMYGGVGTYGVFSNNEVVATAEVVNNEYIRIYAQSVGTAELTVQDDAHNAALVRIVVEPDLREAIVLKIDYEIEGVSEEEKELIKEELTATEEWNNAHILFEFDQADAGQLTATDGKSSNHLIENVPFVWSDYNLFVDDGLRASLNFVYRGNLLAENIDSTDCNSEIQFGAWELDVTSDFQKQYPGITSLKKIFWVTIGK